MQSEQIPDCCRRAMNILWISGRRLGHDLADSTEIGMFEAINKKEGHQVKIMSPGKMIEWKNKHIPLKTLNLPGLVTISGAFQIRSKIGKNLKNQNRFMLEKQFVNRHSADHYAQLMTEAKDYADLEYFLFEQSVAYNDKDTMDDDGIPF